MCASTLDFASSAVSHGKKDEYFFYSLDTDYEEILTLQNILESQFPKTEKSHLNELKQLLEKQMGITAVYSMRRERYDHIVLTK